MTLLPLLFWTLFLLPGYSVARRFLADELEGGLLPGIAVSWTCAFAVLSPLVAIGYLVEAPMPVAMVLLAGFIAWGLVDVLRSNTWRGVGRLLLAALTIEAVLVAIELVFSARHGSILAADARVHLARIRFLYDHGLTNLDPFVQGGNPYPIYHTNLHHAIFATGSRLVGTDPVTFWFGSLAAAKLMIASGVAYLAWAVLGGRWAAWIAAVMVLANRGPVTFSVYPNQLAPWFLLPVFAGVLVRTLAGAWRDPARPWWSNLPKLAGVAMVIGMFHPLYAGFAAVVASPILVGVGAWRLLRRRGGGKTALAGLLVVMVFALPFPIAGKLMTVGDRDVAVQAKEVRRQISGGAAGTEIDDRRGIEEGVATSVGDGNSKAPTRGARAARLLKAPDGWMNTTWGETIWISRTPGRGFTGAYRRGSVKAWRVMVVLICGGLALALAGRREVWYLIAAIGVVQAVVLVPPVATAAVRFLGAHWMLERFETLAFVFFVPLSVPALAAAVEPACRRCFEKRRFGGVFDRGVLAVLTVAGLLVGMTHATHRRPYDWEYYWNRVSAPLQYRHGQEYLGLLRLQRFLESSIPAGSVVAVETFTGTRLKMLHDIVLVASERSSTGVVDGGRRRIDLQLMFDFDTEEQNRAALFEKYGVTHVVSRGSPRPWIDWWEAESVRKRGYVVTRLADDFDVEELWRRELKRGIRLIRAKRYDEAVETLREVVADDPRLEKAWHQLGIALRNSRDSVLSAEAFARAGELGPDDLRYPFLEGLADFDAERYSRALGAFDRAYRLALSQDDTGQAASAMLNIGNTWYMLGNKSEALAAYDVAIEIDPEYEKAIEYREAVAELLAEEAAAEADTPRSNQDQSESEEGRPAREDISTPSERPIP
jgi:tetratricopeptide (TPR) repeat protein